MRASPPITPPTIAPIGAGFGGVGVGVGVGVVKEEREVWGAAGVVDGDGELVAGEEFVIVEDGAADDLFSALVSEEVVGDGEVELELEAAVDEEAAAKTDVVITVVTIVDIGSSGADVGAALVDCASFEFPVMTTCTDGPKEY
jgi:hypothetical protein